MLIQNNPDLWLSRLQTWLSTTTEPNVKDEVKGDETQVEQPTVETHEEDTEELAEYVPMMFSKDSHSKIMIGNTDNWKEIGMFIFLVSLYVYVYFLCSTSVMTL